MGNYTSRNSSFTTDSSPISNENQYQSTRSILINQATCYQCNTSITDRGICKCGNVEIFGGREELGRRVKKTEWYGDCSLFEYRRVLVQ